MSAMKGEMLSRRKRRMFCSSRRSRCGLTSLAQIFRSGRRQARVSDLPPGAAATSQTVFFGLAAATRATACEPVFWT